MPRITVYGIPAPQGSKRHVGHGILVESSKKVKPWREAVKYAVRELMDRDMVSGRDGKIPGAVRVAMFFTLPRPKSLSPKVMWPSKRPDLDKLVRSTFDGICDSGIIEDDARIISIVSEKLFPSTYPLSLDSPGVLIDIDPAIDP